MADCCRAGKTVREIFVMKTAADSAYRQRTHCRRISGQGAKIFDCQNIVGRDDEVARRVAACDQSIRQGRGIVFPPGQAQFQFFLDLRVVQTGGRCREAAKIGIFGAE